MDDAIDQTAVQLMLRFSDRRVEQPILVRLSDCDRKYRQDCIDKDVEFSGSFLLETRAQRLGCSVRDIECMLNYERNRHLADEAVVMRHSSWAIERAAYIDWGTINQRAVIKSQELASDFAAFRTRRRESMQVEKPSKRKN
jgi:hypothetical protein